MHQGMGGGLMLAREQGISAVGSVPKTKINTEKARPLDAPSVEHPAATISGTRAGSCEKFHAK